MINVTDTIKEAYSKSTTQYDKIVLDDEEYAINNVELDDDCYEEGNIFGTAIAKALSFEIDGSVDLERKEFKYYTGIKTTTGIEWIDLGTYITQDVEPNDTTKINTVNAMDYMLKTNIEYTSDLQYSNNNVTLGQVAQEACNKAGITLATTDFPNVDFIVDSNQFPAGTLIRQVISAIAQMSGTVAKVKNDDKLYFITPKTNGTVRKVFNLSDYSEAEIKRATHPINLVSLGMSNVEGENVVMRDENSIALYGENALVINDNPFAYTEAKRQQLITAIFNAVKGFEYKSYEMTVQGLPYLETLDNIQIVDFEGNIYNSFLFRFYNKSPNGLETEISAPSIIKSIVAYQNVASAEQIAKRTELIVDKQNQQIQGIINQIGDRSEKETTITADIDRISAKVNTIQDLTRDIDGTKIIILENCIAGELLELHIYGNNSVFSYLFPSDTLFPSNNLFPYGDSRIAVTDQNNNVVLYELGVKDVLRQNGDVKDEYILKNGKAQVVRRINKDGSIKDSETIEELGELKIPLSNGKNRIEIKNYSANLSAKWAIQSDYSEIFTTKVETEASIELNNENINIELSKKTDKDKIIAAINMSTEENEDGSQMQLLADKISLEGKDIDLTGENVTISSKNFNVDAEGNMECNNATFNGGTLTYYSRNGDFLGEQSVKYYIDNISGTEKDVVTLFLTDNGTAPSYVIAMPDVADVLQCRKIDSSEIHGFSGSEYCGHIIIKELLSVHNLRTSYISTTSPSENSAVSIEDGLSVRKVLVVDENAAIKGTCYATNFGQYSTEEKKKNISETNLKALDIIKKSVLYDYNWNTENDKNRKHLGFIIGDGYKTPKEVLTEDNKAINLYDVSSLNWKAIQELAEIVEKQQKEIEMLKEGK